MQKLGIVMAALAALVVLAGVGGSSAQELTVLLNPKSVDNPFFLDARDGCQNGAKQFKVKCEFNGTTESDVAKQIQFLGVDQIAAFFAAQKREPTPLRTQPEAVARGRTVAAQCVICHGESGRGDAARLIPGLAGQPPGYLAQQMVLFKADTRDPGDPLLVAKKALMRTIPDGQFPDLAAYYSSLR